MAHYFTKAGLGFLRDLDDHNDRDWFAANKDRYDHDVRDPALRLIADLAAPLRKVSKHFAVDARPTGGSLSRIHRDTRFSKDKSPYKTWLFIHFWHDSDSEDAPAFFLHIQPGKSTVGGGVRQPSPAALGKIRDAMVASPAAWRKVGSGVGAACPMSGEVLKRVPKGYDPDSPLADDLKRKDFGIGTPLPDKLLTGDGLLPVVEQAIGSAKPLVAFLCKAVGLEL